MRELPFIPFFEARGRWADPFASSRSLYHDNSATVEQLPLRARVVFRRTHEDEATWPSISVNLNEGLIPLAHSSLVSSFSSVDAQREDVLLTPLELNRPPEIPSALCTPLRSPVSYSKEVSSSSLLGSLAVLLTRLPLTHSQHPQPGPVEDLLPPLGPPPLHPTLPRRLGGMVPRSTRRR